MKHLVYLLILLNLWAFPLVDIPLASCQVRASVISRIATQEGYYARRRTLPQKLFNPCSLVFARQPRAVRDRTGFARFADELAGFSACERDVYGKVRRHVPPSRGWKYLK